ncbi:hypothetical protein [Microbulbifer epialgicus]|uniref:Uncharacterized protein n=1 Tax=Microbulbifer epialgicus TaxID=393907 RepID=A0ABV4P2D7_9GAMM
MTKIAETYIHLDINLDENSKSKLKDYLIAQAPKYAKGIYEQSLQFEAFVEDGSLKVWLTYAGIIYAGVSAYGSFRSGIDHLIKDARAVSEMVLEDLKDSGVPEPKIINFQRRLGVPGQIKRTLSEVKKLDNEHRNLTEQERTERITSIRKSMERISKNIDNQEDADVIRNNIPSFLKSSIPERLPKRDMERAKMIALRPEEFIDRNYLPTSYPALSVDTSISTNLWKSNLFKLEETSSGIQFVPK